MKLKLAILLSLVVLLFNCGVSQKETKIKTLPNQQVDEWYNTKNGLVQTGVASWYGPNYHGKRTSNGEIFDMDKLTAAHNTLPFHTLIEVENLDNNKKVLVRINDRGPFVKGRIIDLSKRAGQLIGITDTGTAQVRLRIVKASEIGIPSPQEKPATPPSQEKPIVKEEIAVTDVKETQHTTLPQTDNPSQPETINLYPPPDQKSSPPVIKKENTALNGYYLQAGAFSSMKNANRLKRKIEQILPDISFRVDFKDGLYKVLSSTLNSREVAETLKRSLKAKEIEAFIREN